MKNRYPFHPTRLIDRSRRAFRALAAIALLAVVGRAPAGASAAELSDSPVISIAPPPAGVSGSFASYISRLANGNIVVFDENWGDGVSTNVGAVYLYDGATGALISRLTGSSADDYVGGGDFIELENSNFVVATRMWNGERGAVTWIDGSVGLSGVVSITNSLVGSTPLDNVGRDVVPLTNGKYVVTSEYYSGTVQVGAVTWAPSTGITGFISTANSLIGNAVGIGAPLVYTLTNGNYVVVSLSGGSVTWANGATGITGVINASNSVMAYLPPAAFGGFLQDNVTRLANGNFVVRSESVGVIPGAFTWMRGDGPTTGTLSVTNSLVISETWGNTAIFPLKNGDYVVCDTYNLRSAAIWGSGTSGVTGTVSDRNALLGPSSVDGYSNICNDESWPGQFLSFDDGSYAMLGIVWVGGSDGRHERAMTVVQGSNHFTGVVTMTNSLLSDGAKFQRLIPLTGTAFLLHAVYPDGHPLAGRSVFARVDATAGLTGAFTTTGGLYLDSSGWPRVMPLDDGNFVIYDGGWNGGRGIVHWHDGSGPMVGEINASNSLVGECADQEVGDAITPLRNGRYVIGSPGWEPCGSAVTDIGAATWMESGPATGSVSVTNSIVGNSADDKVGYAYFDTDYWDDQFGVLHNSGDWSMPVAEWDRGADTDVGALMSLPGDRRVTGTVAGLSHLAIYGLAADSGGSSGTFNALAEDQGHTVVSWWGTDQRMYLSRALWPALVANTVGAGKITGGGLDCGVSCTVDIHYGTPTVLTATGIGANDFAGWSGACSGLQPCTLPMTMTTQVTATFVAGTASSDASLNSLTLSDGTLVPAFASATTNYTASVANAVSSVTCAQRTHARCPWVPIPSRWWSGRLMG
ncbi:MAG: hypothetical protein NTZ50_16100 [Chloroflexi bacterium]|nr:hypothetical protein [Chloroflexota bacterium]